MQGILLLRHIVFVLGLMLASTSLQAKTVMQSMSFNPYIGLDYQYENIKGNLDWNKLLPLSYQNQAIFLGNRYHQFFGIELGYYSTLKKSTGSATFNAFNGQPASSQTVAYSQIKMKGFSFEWNAFAQWDPNFYIFSVLGFVTVHPTFTMRADGSSNLATALRKISGSNKTLLRLGAGAEYSEKSWGMRGKILWDHTQKLYINTNGAQNNFRAIDKKAFKQAVVFVVGLFYKF